MPYRSNVITITNDKRTITGSDYDYYKKRLKNVEFDIFRSAVTFGSSIKDLFISDLRCEDSRIKFLTKEAKVFYSDIKDSIITANKCTMTSVNLHRTKLDISKYLDITSTGLSFVHINQCKFTSDLIIISSIAKVNYSDWYVIASDIEASEFHFALGELAKTKIKSKKIYISLRNMNTKHFDMAVTDNSFISDSFIISDADKLTKVDRVDAIIHVIRQIKRTRVLAIDEASKIKADELDELESRLKGLNLINRLGIQKILRK